MDRDVTYVTSTVESSMSVEAGEAGTDRKEMRCRKTQLTACRMIPGRGPVRGGAPSPGIDSDSVLDAPFVGMTNHYPSPQFLRRGSVDMARRSDNPRNPYTHSSLMVPE